MATLSMATLRPTRINFSTCSTVDYVSIITQNPVSIFMTALCDKHFGPPKVCGTVPNLNLFGYKFPNVVTQWRTVTWWTFGEFSMIWCQIGEECAVHFGFTTTSLHKHEIFLCGYYLPTKIKQQYAALEIELRMRARIFTDPTTLVKEVNSHWLTWSCDLSKFVMI
ncbi:hypothetical protein AVEN_102710-1 [Araneus ventricosus]|uniref:Uncharacterized protein n=1 Tax=Araneus ventricosus TaxID=182803 RepID=A0A4Y2WLG4_ARAVE|nr:hypothetical protein AVEN_192672-1 [Araneus ventricosus]GBO38367.1 hypothetical protein AVEN_102710-1 [Araneus ventricosus]